MQTRTKVAFFNAGQLQFFSLLVVIENRHVTSDHRVKVRETVADRLRSEEGMVVAGAMGYVTKDESPEVFVEAIRLAVSDIDYFLPRYSHVSL